MHTLIYLFTCSAADHLVTTGKVRHINTEKYVNTQNLNPRKHHQQQDILLCNPASLVGYLVMMDQCKH